MALTSEIKCTQCEFSCLSSVTWGPKYYLTANNEKISVDRKLGWCFDCDSIAPVESLDDEALVAIQIDELEQSRKCRLMHHIFRVISPSYRTKMKKLKALEIRLMIIKTRADKEVCLKCGTRKILTFSQEARAALQTPNRPTVPHPGCSKNGNLYSEPSMYLSIKMSPKYYNTEGQPIEPQS